MAFQKIAVNFPQVTQHVCSRMKRVSTYRPLHNIKAGKFIHVLIQPGKNLIADKGFKYAGLIPGIFYNGSDYPFMEFRRINTDYTAQCSSISAFYLRRRY